LPNLITFPSSVTVTVHAPCHVTYHRGTVGLHLRSLNPIYLFILSLLGATRKIKPCHRRKKWTLSHCEVYKVQYTCAVSRDLCIGDPPQKKHVKFFATSNCVFTIQLFWGYGVDYG